MVEDISLVKQTPYVTTLVIISLLIMLFDGFGLLVPVRRTIEHVSVPVQFGLYRSWQAVRENVQLISEIKKQHKLIGFLEAEVNRLNNETVRIRQLEEENKALRSQLSATDPASFSLLPARTLGGERYLSIDKGSDHGVAKDMVVIAENIVLGKIKDVQPRFSLVQLVTDPDSKINVEVLVDKGVAKGILYGQFQSGLLLDQVLQEERIKEGDLVVTSGENQQFPQGMLIGKITEVKKEEAEVFQKAEVKPLVEIRNTRIVFVIL